MTTVSIALATYNGARFIGEQLDSFARQTRLPDELVVCDDGSTDGTLEIVERFAAASPFTVRIHRNPERLGFSKNFENALSKCSGDLLFISDQDDIWYPNKLSSIEQELKFSGTLSVVHDEHVIDEDGRVEPATFLTLVRRAGLKPGYLVAGNCSAFRRELFPIFAPFSASINYDNWIALLADLLGVRRVVPIPVQMYRRHHSNASEPELLGNGSSYLHRFRYAAVDPRDGWNKQIALLQEAIARIGNRASLIDSLTSEGRAAAAIREAEMEIEFLSERLRLIAVSRLRRFVPIVRLWKSGFYDRQSGLKSAIKDLVRS